MILVGKSSPPCIEKTGFPDAILLLGYNITGEMFMKGDIILSASEISYGERF